MTFARRTGWRNAVDGLTARLEAFRSAGRPVIDLTESNPTRCGFAYPSGAIAQALSDASVLAYDPDPRGALSAREAISSDYAEKGARVPPDRILLTASTSEAYTFLFRLLADPGDRILAPAPSYPLFDLLARLADVTLDHYPLDPAEGFAIDLAALASRIDERTRAILLVSPGNPSGACLKRHELEAIRSLCAPRGIPILCDEVFADYLLAPAPDRVATTAGFDGLLTFTMNGISKGLALPQIKLGWIAMSGPSAECAEALSRLEVIADTYLSVSAPAQSAVARLLPRKREIQSQVLARVQGNRAWLAGRLAGMPSIGLLPAEAGWSAVLRIPATRPDEERCVHLLEDDGVFVYPGWYFDFPREGFLVLSLLPPEATFREGAGRLLERLAAEH